MGILTPVAVLCVWLGQPQAETCELAPKFEAGRRLVYEVRTVTEMFPVGAPNRAAAPASSAYTTAATLRFTIDSVDEGGTATVLGTFVRLRSELAVGGKSYRLELKEGEPPPPGPAADDGPGAKPNDAAGAVDAVTRALFGCVIRMEVKPDGRVEAVSGLEEAGLTATTWSRPPHGPHGTRLLAGLMPEIADRTLSNFFRMDEPDAAGKPVARKVGDLWALTERAPISSALELVGTTTLKLTRLDRDAAAISGTLRVAVEPAKGADGKPVEADPAAPVPELLEQSGAMTAKWDMVAGVLLERSRQQNLTFVTKIGARQSQGQPMSARSEIRLIERKAGPGGAGAGGVGGGG